jgi:hypothetical protein
MAYSISQVNVVEEDESVIGSYEQIQPKNDSSANVKMDNGTNYQPMEQEEEDLYMVDHAELGGDRAQDLSSFSIFQQYWDPTMSSIRNTVATEEDTSMDGSQKAFWNTDGPRQWNAEWSYLCEQTSLSPVTHYEALFALATGMFMCAL